MVNQTPLDSKYMHLSRIQDELRWDCFLEGRIPIALLEAVKISLPSRQSITKWGVSFIKTLLSVTHRQWFFRNADVHHRFDSLTMHGHNILSLRINELLETSPADLLPVHRYLLQKDFFQLGTADTIQRQIWVATMESALGAASSFHSGHLTPGSLHKFFSTRQRPKQAHHLHPTSRNHHQHPRCPLQQTLPASFFVPKQACHFNDSPPPLAFDRSNRDSIPTPLEKKVAAFQSGSGLAQMHP